MFKIDFVLDFLSAIPTFNRLIQAAITTSDSALYSPGGILCQGS